MSARCLVLSLVPFLAVTSSVAASAYGQSPPSLGDRVSALEQKQGNVSGSIDLLNQLHAMQAEMQQMQGKIEQLEHENTELKQDLAQQHADLIARFSQLQSVSTEKNPPPSPHPDPSNNYLQKKENVVKNSSPAPLHDPTETAAYVNAFHALKSGHYADASAGFLSYLKKYPHAEHTPNAMYWLGESYYATGNYELAKNQFQQVVSSFPNSDKAAGGLLKQGMCEIELHQQHAGQLLLQQVVARYPGTDVAHRAQSLLSPSFSGQKNKTTAH